MKTLPHSPQQKQRGQMMPEYIVISVVILIVLGASFVGEDGTSVIDTFVESAGKAYTKLSTFLSIPL